MRQVNYEKLAREARLIVVELEFQMFRDPLFNDSGDEPQVIEERLKAKYDGIRRELEGMAKEHVRIYMPDTHVGAKNICSVHLYKTHGPERYRILKGMRALGDYNLIMVEDAVDYFSGISRGVEKGTVKSVLLTEDGKGDLMEPAFYEMFRGTEENIVCGCYREYCVADFAGKLREIVPRKVKIAGKWTVSFRDRQKEIYVQGEI